MRIGELSAATGVSVRSLRYYEEQGLLSADRTSSGQRAFGPDAPARVDLIQDLFGAGICSATMVDLLPCMSDPGARTPKLRSRLLEERDRISKTIANLTATQAALDRIISENNPNEGRLPGLELRAD
ncbi:MerR family transcriptional regulator [Arthrobacter sp. CG_A4]|uniref:MerR family transcriptional regulator n=1 Tax=Arthrobacter sp. CG_A4 TaxID=3071706 RepID=UPI002E0B8F16|nr:DNA-binding transcriptional MerR regulator [Arthrobacter sp. CG_A4]